MNRTTNGAASASLMDSDASRRIVEGLERLDFARAQAMRRASAIQATQAAGAAREHDRLAAKYGDSHPRVRAARARVAVESRLAEAVALHADEAATPPPGVDDDSWLVQGRVLWADGTPARGLTAALYHPGVGWDRASGHACTDANGVFTLRGTAVDGQYRELGVSQAGTVLHRDPRLLVPEIGTLDTRVIVLGGQGANATAAASCPPPEPGLTTDRGVAPDCPEPQGVAGTGATGTGSTGTGSTGTGSTGTGSTGTGSTGTGAAGTGAAGTGAAGTGVTARDAWSVRGKVTEADGKPAAGLTVNLYDRDLLFDDRLGRTTTDAGGEYRFTYRTRDFRDFIERRPDLYLEILDAKGASLVKRRAKVRPEAGREEVIDVKLPRRKQG